MTRLRGLASVLLVELMVWQEALELIEHHSIRGWTQTTIVEFAAKHDLDLVELLDDCDGHRAETLAFDQVADAIFDGSYYRVREEERADDVALVDFADGGED